MDFLDDKTKEQIVFSNNELIKKKLPIEIRNVILLNSFDIQKLALECDKNPEFLDICKVYKQTICKEALIYFGYNNKINQQNDYCRLLNEILNIIRTIDDTFDFKNFTYSIISF
jgi:hypothetical protein